MATSPQLPPDEVPLTDAEFERVFAKVGEDMVLIGDQAQQFWMLRFGIPTRGLKFSNTAEFLGSAEEAGASADRLVIPLQKPSAPVPTALVAQLCVPLRKALFYNIDVLHQVHATSTPKKTVEFTQRVKRNAMTVKWTEDSYIRVMDPFDLLESRVQNAVGFASEQMKGAHVITQARWAIEVVKAALFLLASGDEEFTSRVGHKIQQIVRFARSSPGRRAWHELGIDVLDAIDADLIQAMAPTSAVQLVHVRVMQRRRAKEGG
jgi:hypothetical protein